MKNSKFNIKIDFNSGCITEISNPLDSNNMNWCSDLTQWGKINTQCHTTSEYHSHFDEKLALKSLSAEESFSTAVYENNRYKITVNRFFKDNGNLTEQVIIKNITETVLCINRDNFGIAFPFNDKYTYADDCLTNRCHTHIWCGYNTSWINALRMGESKINLGMVLTKGSFVSYSQYECSSNVRGYFELEPESVLLKSNEEYTLQWELFWHEGKKDFFSKLSHYESYIGIEAEHFTVFKGEKIKFRIIPHNNKKPTVFLSSKEISVDEKNGGYFVSYTPSIEGEHKFIIKCGNISTYAEFMVKIPFKELTEKRLDFIVTHQQCLDKESPLYGAYLVYDNKISSQYFDFYNTDHNACRERMNMPLAIIRYLQLHNNDKLRASLDLYIDFLFREFYEEKTGEVFNNIGKNQDALRLYNAPGVMLIFAEMYHYTSNEKYLDNIIKLASKYYSIGGEKCYSNAVAIKKTISAFELSHRTADKEKMLEFFGMHVNNMLKNGTSYPKHEVNYEQTIVTPAVNCISEFGLFCENKEFYIQNVKKHLECLDRFSGNQPSFHLNEIAIRYWDDFWFGKAKKFGDTLPHHLSCLTARAFTAYAVLSGETEYITRAEECIRNCLCLIGDNAQGAAAYVYPNTVNRKSGEFYDEWANDQDLILYDALYLSEYVEAFKIKH